MNLMKLAKPFMTAAFVCLFAIFSHAQTKTVSGKVTDAKDGSPLVGASVTAKGSRTGTTTGADGSYKLTVPSGTKTLVISSVGFGSMEVDVANASSANASLTATTDNLADVVVVGYGTRKAKDLTGSVAKVTEKDFNKGQISSPEQLLQGRTPGVLVTPATGEPGSAATINIRGTGSISGNNEPLYVIDGVPLIQGGTLGSASGVEGGTTAKNPLIFLNPNDIESMTVLKDASAAAIYGSRGANGVILITTKTGARGGKRGTFNFGANMSVANTARRYDLMDAQGFLLAAKKANIDGGADPIGAADAVKLIDKGANTDWQDQIYRTAISQNYNLGWAYNNKGTTVRLSGSYDDQQGVVRNSSLKRLTTRANISQKILGDKLRLDVNMTYSNTKNQYPPLSNNAGFQGSLLGAALQSNPTYPVYNPDGSFFQPGNERNPAQMLAYFDDRDKINRFLGNATLTWNITKNLAYRGVLGYDNSQSQRTSFADPRLGSNAYGGTNNIFGRDLNNQISGNGRTTRQNLNVKSLLVEHYFTYDNTWGNHTLNAVAGYSYQNFETQYDGTVGWGLNTPVVAPTDVFIKEYNNFKNYATFVPNYERNELQSVFGRANYSYADRYFLTATVRTDGSSKFGSNNRYATFPAFAFKWKLMNEAFAQKSFLGKLFSDVSFRANYGSLGSQDNLGAYAALNLQQTFNPGTGSATRFIQQGNPDLKWETLTTTGFGIDLTSKDRRLNITVDYYNTKRKDMLFFAPTPGGFAPQANWWINLDGNVINKGWEGSISYAILDKTKFKWDASFNFTTVNNNVEGLPAPINTGVVNGQGLTGAFAQTLTNGNPIFTWTMPVFQGFDGNGNARYAAGAANQLVGTALPKFYAGFTNNFTYGRWSLSLFFNAVSGHYVYNNTANALFLKGSLRNARNVTNEVGNGPENPFNPGSVSTRFLEKGDFIRLANANLNYQFSLKSKYLKTLNVFASGQNLFLITKYSGIDPEVNVDKNINGIPSRGFDYTQYPRPTVFTIGANIGF